MYMKERHEIYFDEKHSRAYRCRVLEVGYLGMYVTIETAAAMLKVTRQAVEKRIHGGGLKFYETHDGRLIVSLADVEAMQANKPKRGRPKKQENNDNSIDVAPHLIVP